MNKKIVALSVLIVTVLFVSTLAGTIVYYNGIVNDRNSRIALLNSQIANLNGQISNLKIQVANLTGQITNLTSANLVTTLNVTELSNNSDLVQMFPQFPVASVPGSLWINGSITNTGHVTAYNAGLHVIAYNNGALEINMTVPLANGVFGTDSTTNAFILNHTGYVVTMDGGIGRGYVPPGSLPLGSLGSLQLGSLEFGHTANVKLAIYHEGTVTNWTVTPRWTNSP